MSDQRDGQVSESSKADGAVSDGDSVHGAPENGPIDTGAAGGDSAPPENQRDNDFEPRHRKPGAPVVGG